MSSSPPSSPPLPAYLARHVDLGFNDSDVAALLHSIDSSQQKTSSHSASRLPAELLLQILEYVPIDYILDWRLICRGFRDAIDGRIPFHHLRRTQLLGYIGPKHARPMERLDDEQYGRIHLLPAQFHHVESNNEIDGTQSSGPIWNSTYAIFQISDSWFDAFHQIGGAATNGSDTIADADARWRKTLDRLQLLEPEEGFGTLRWCIRLDHAVLDLDFPLELGRATFGIEINLHHRVVRVEWKPMLHLFLRTESSLRRMVTRKRDSPVTFSLAEDCLRATRRSRLLANLNPDAKVDRHLKWSLRLLHPLFGKTTHDPRLALEDVENDAARLLLLLRREAGMSARQIAALRQLLDDFAEMEADMAALDLLYREFKSHLAMPGFQLSVELPGLSPRRISRNPFSWPDDLLAKIEEQVGKWKDQRGVVRQVKMLLGAGNMALTLPEDGFEDVGSDF